MRMLLQPRLDLRLLTVLTELLKYLWPEVENVEQQNAEICFHQTFHMYFTTCCLGEAQVYLLVFSRACI